MPKIVKDSIWYVIERLGLPTVLIVLVGYWSAGHVVDPLVKSHAEYLDQQVGVSRQQAKTLDNLSRLIDEMQRAHEAQNAMLREITAHQQGRVDVSPNAKRGNT